MSPNDEIRPAEVCALSGMTVVILTYCVLSSSLRPFWLDEILTVVLVTDPSFGHMLEALKDQINALPPAHFVLGWIWTQAFGGSEVSLRLASALVGAAAMWFVWLGLRQFTNRWAAVACAALLCLLSHDVRVSLSDARCYALYFAAFAAAVWLYLRPGDLRSDARLRVLPLVVATHALLITTHYVGGLLSALLVVCAFAACILEGHRGHSSYAVSALAAWPVFLPCIPFYLAQKDMASTYSNLARPDLQELLAAYSFNIGGFAILTIGLLVVLLALDGGRPPGFALPGDHGAARRSSTIKLVLLVLGVSGFLVAVWLESQWGARIFSMHYLFPCVVAWIGLYAWGLGRVFDRLADCTSGWMGRCVTGAEPHAPGSSRCRLLQALPAVASGLFVVAAIGVLAGDGYRRLHHERSLSERLRIVNTHPGWPVVTTNVHDFSGLAYYGRSEARTFMVTDSWAYDGTATGLRVAQALNRHYFPQTVVSLDGFLQASRRFLLVKGSPQLLSRLEARPELKGRKIGSQVSAWERRDGEGVADDPADRPGISHVSCVGVDRRR